ncbi:MAG: Mpo1-like protein [Polyangiales bacterium]
MKSPLVTPNVVSWQWQNYSTAHRSRRNLVLHALTNPLFTGGIVAAVISGSVRIAIVGVLAAIVAMALQGRGHAGEEEPPAPFRSPVDVIVRIFVEQFVTFPRFVLSGAFFRAFREA